MPRQRRTLRLATAVGAGVAAFVASTGTAGAAWPGVPPTSVVAPATALDIGSLLRDAVGAASIATTEVDWYTFRAPVTGTYVISTATPGNGLDTVLGVFGATGSRLAFNDDGYPDSFDSRLAVPLTEGNRYYVGITNYTATPGGAYLWRVERPK